MTHQECWRFCEQIRGCLEQKGYTEVRLPIAGIAMLKQTFGGTLPKVIALVDGFASTNPPSMLYDGLKTWFKGLLGRTGAGVVLFILAQPSAATVDTVLQLGRGALGYGQVVAGVYDLFTNKYWLSDHMGWPQEIFH